MPEKITIETASRSALCMACVVFTTSRGGMIYAGRERRSWVSLNAITPCRLPVGLVSEFPHLKKQHTDASEHSSHDHGGECQWCNAAVNN